MNAGEWIGEQKLDKEKILKNTDQFVLHEYMHKFS